MEKINLYVFGGMIAVLMVIIFLLPSDPQAEVFENRVMQTRPTFTIESFVSREYFYNLENYFLDNSFGRTTWLRFGDIVDRSFGVRLPGSMMVYFGADDLGYGLVPTLAQIGGLTTATLTTGYNVDPNLPFGEDSNFHDHAVFFLRYIEDTELAIRYAEVLNSFRREIPETVRMFSLVAPVKVAFMGERYAAANSSQIGTIELINSLLDPGIIPVDAYHALHNHAEEYLFFRTDHHWTAIGAYRAYHAFAAAAGIEPITIDNYLEHAIHGFIGSLAIGTQNPIVLAHPDIIYLYELNNGTTFSTDLFAIPQNLAYADYRVFLGGDHPRIEFSSSNQNGETLVVVKDSFANPLIIWLAPNYENVIVVDPRQYTGSILEILRENYNADLLFVNYIPATTMRELIEQIYGGR
ncbi:MAG: DHHW family protein [Defluviitaleaceae bacterium]|nr:DHHW family protein [Defluviitaleaceae bacterium]